jgi:hyperosmotically inducible protein
MDIFAITALLDTGESLFVNQVVQKANRRRIMSSIYFCRTAVLNMLIAVGLVTGVSIGTAGAASGDDTIPQPHSDSVSATLTDTVITTRVKAKLMGSDSLKKSDISVTTTNGVVTLDGSVSNSNAKTVAEAATKSVDGVKSVDNNLKTPASSKASARTHEAVTKTERVASDSWITTKVKSGILADSVSKGFDVSVETIHGVVVLKGALSNQDAVDHVKDIAEKVKGVKSVDTSALTVAGG